MLSSSEDTNTTTQQQQPSQTSTVMTDLPPPKIRHEWFQTDSFVTISVFIKNLKPENCKIDISAKDVFVSITNPTSSSSNTTLSFDLSHPIVPNESKWGVLSTKIEIKLKKENIGLKWGTLEGEDNTINGVIVAPVSDSTSAPSYPSSSKKKINFNEIEKAVDDEKAEGEAALNALFQKIYKDGSEETRRAMMKSFVESNGTCLSTNWEEVGHGKVECKPPDGMQVKKFEK